MAFDPSSVLALWKFDEGSGRVAKNANAPVVNDGTNLCPVPEQVFNTHWTKSGVTVTDYDSGTKSRLLFAAGDRTLTYGNHALAPGQYTISAAFESRDGADHNIRLGFVTNFGSSSNSSNIPVLNADGETRKSFTFTIPGGTLGQTAVIRNDGTNAADVRCRRVKIEAGAVATDYQPQALDFLIPDLNGPTWTSTGLTDTAGNKRALALEDSPTTFSELTMIVACTQSADSVLYQLGFSDNGNFTNLGFPAGNGPNAGEEQGGFLGGGNVFTQAKYPTGPCVLAIVLTGSERRFYHNGTRVRTLSGGSSFQLKGLLWGNLAGFGFTGERHAAILDDRAFSDAEVREATAWLY